MAEHRIVVPGVVGSNPITHPIYSFFDRNGKKEWIPGCAGIAKRNTKVIFHLRDEVIR